MTATLAATGTLEALYAMEGALVLVTIWPAEHEVDRPAARLAGVLRRHPRKSGPTTRFLVLPAGQEGGTSPFQFSVFASATSEWGVAGRRVWDCPPDPLLVVETAGLRVCVENLTGANGEKG